MRWNQLTTIAELDELIKLSERSTVLILKHSTRCNISRMSLDRLERKWKESDEQKILPYFLDLLNHRDISNEIEKRFGVEHQSPQVLLIRNGKCIYSATHTEIDYGDIMDEAS